MPVHLQDQRLRFPPRPRSSGAIILSFAIALVLAGAAQAQTLTILHAFGSTSGDGMQPYAGLTADAGGNLYGTTFSGGVGHGTVFQLKRLGAGFVYRPLYSFQGGDDGDSPYAKVTVGPNGSLYGTTANGGGVQPPYNNGIVFNLKPPPAFCTAVFCPWTETVLFRFDEQHGSNPYAPVVFDQAGNLYGTVYGGGEKDDGEVFELTPSNGSWTFNFVYSFQGSDGRGPVAGVIFGAAGDLYGTTRFGGSQGNVYQLTPSGQSWTAQILYAFTGYDDGGQPESGVIMDQSGALYGTTGWDFFTNDPGTVYQLTPSGGGWTYSLLYHFPNGWDQGAGSVSDLTMDKDGNLYGTKSSQGIVASNCPYGCGSVFKLTRSNGGWTYTDVYQFTGGADGASPYGGVFVDSQGSVYGTASYGGDAPSCTPLGCGTVWKIAP